MDGSKKVKQAFENEFIIAIVNNERLRTAMLAVVLGFVFVTIIILFIFFRVDYDTLFQDQLGIIVLLLSISILAIYEWSVHYLLGKQKIHTRLHTQFLSYINSFIEISLPSFLLILLTSVSHSRITMISPVVVTYFLIIILSTLRLDLKLSIFTGILAAIEYILIYTHFFYSTSANRNPNFEISSALFIGWGIMFIGAGIAAGFVAEQIKIRIRQYFRLNQERNEIVNLFGQQVSHSIVEELLKQKPDLGSKKQKVTVMFLDIREFTPFAEKHSPEVVVDYLNKLFSTMIEIVNSNHGIINQFLGDGFMATFGVPVSRGNHAKQAVQAGLEIIDKVADSINDGKIPPTKLGIGIHSGKAITGNIGTDVRKQYSITGNVVILASRIEQLNKQYGTQLLISEEVKRAAFLKDNSVEFLGEIKLKGRSNEIVIYKLA